MHGVCWFLGFLAFSAAGPVTSPNPTFIGEGTESLASELLKNHASDNENLVFSPLGINTLLAIFAEGARESTRDEIASALSFPTDETAVRQGYQTVLKRLSEKYRDNVPEMKNWFYVYKNYSVEPELVEVLRQYYLTEVKLVSRPEEFLNEKQATKIKVPEGFQGKPTDHLINVDKEVESIIHSASSAPHKSDGEEASSNSQPAHLNEKETLNDKDVANEASTQNSGSVNNHERPQLSTKQQTEIQVAENEKEVKKNQEEMMVAMQRADKDPIDDMSGMTDSAIKINKNGSTSHMVVFNGLYYKGNWENELVKLPADDSRAFHKSNGEKVYVQTLHATGLFQTADCPELKSQALELKYAGGRYSLFIVVPHQGEDLSQLLVNLDAFPVSQIYNRLSEKYLQLCLPVFQITTISKPVSSAKRTGILNIQKIFDPESANLSGISKEEGLFVEELVQLVTFKVDSNFTEANFLTASIGASTRSEIPDEPEKFQVNRPFVFYLRDNIDGIVVVNGKVVDPTPTDDEFTKQSLRNTVKTVVD